MSFLVSLQIRPANRQKATLRGLVTNSLATMEKTAIKGRHTAGVGCTEEQTQRPSIVVLALGYLLDTGNNARDSISCAPRRQKRKGICQP